MATIYPPNNRNRIGARVALTWGPWPTARILGWTANFAGVVGGETVTIGAGAAAPAVITFLAGDITAALIAARINLTYPGLASVAPDGGVLLVHATRVRVTASPNFDLIGLPIMDRNVADPATESLIVPISLDPASLGDMASSNYVEIPNEANRVGVYIGTLINDTNAQWGVSVAALWSNGTEGEPPYATNGFGTSTTIADPSLSFPTGDEARGVTFPEHLELILPVSGLEGFMIWRYHEFVVPIGASRFRLFCFGAASNDASPYTAGNPPPLNPPTLKAAVFVGARS